MQPCSPSVDEIVHEWSTVFRSFLPPSQNKIISLNAGALDEQARQYWRVCLDRIVQVRDGVVSSTELSHGQRKRLALLTAYLEDRPLSF